MLYECVLLNMYAINYGASICKNVVHINCTYMISYPLHTMLPIFLYNLGQCLIKMTLNIYKILRKLILL